MAEPQPVVITSGTNPNPGISPVPLIAVGGLPTKTQVAALTNVTTPDAVASVAVPTKAEFDAVVALTNANKAKINAIIAALKA